MVKIPPIWKEFKIFDAHSHLGYLYDIGKSMTGQDLVAYMERYNISYSAVSALTRNIRKDNDDVANIFRKYPDRIVPLAHVDPHLGGEEAVNEIDRCAKMGFKGVKLHPHYDGYNVYDKDLIFPVMEKASKERLPVLVHTGTPPMSLPIHIAYVAQRFPEVPIICGHMGLCDSSYEAPIAASIAENIYLDMSATNPTVIIEKTVREIGADRIVWGTDTPYLTFESEFFKLLSLNISEENMRKILFDNAMRAYRIEPK